LTDLQMTVDVSGLALTGGLALAAGVVFGLSPALHATRLALADVLKDAGSALAPSRSRLQASLVVTQIALTQPALLAMGALFLEMVTSLRDVPSAASADRILDVRFNTNPRYVTLDSRREETLLRLRTRFESVPGVVSVVPQENADAFLELIPHQADLVPGVEPRFPLSARAHAAPAGYFALMSIPFVLGRDFDRAASDGDGAVVVGTDLARRLWGDADPIGRRLTAGGLDYSVVGVVDDSRASGSGPNDWRIYVPAVRVTGRFLVRTQGPAQPLIPAIRSVANAEAPELSIVTARTLASIEEADRASFMRAIAATGGSAAIALLLSAIGLYAVVAVAVGQRVREIGIRTALGADGRRILSMFLRRGMSLSLAGVFVGIGLAFAGLRLMSAVRGVEPAPGTTAIAPLVALLVTGVALLATWIPARRATRIDPLQALRLE
jgi:ABC-type antimicrobial peptide transport system permease subunit